MYISDDKVEVCDQRVAVCRDHANGQCRRKQCKYYHIPVILPPADVMATILNNNASTTTTSSKNSTAVESVATAPQSPDNSPSTGFLPYEYFIKNLTGSPRDFNCYSYLSLDNASLSPPSIISNSPFIYNSQVRGSLTPAAPSTQTSATSTP